MDADGLRDSLRDSPLLRLVSIAGHLTGQRWSRLMSEQHGMTAAQVNALLMIAWGTGRGLTHGTPGRATHADLARRLWIKPASLTGIVDALERSGYVRRERDEADRRVVWLVLTDAGRGRVREVGAHVRRELVDPVNRTTPEREAIIRDYLIDLIMNYCTEETDDEQPG